MPTSTFVPSANSECGGFIFSSYVPSTGTPSTNNQINFGGVDLDLGAYTTATTPVFSQNGVNRAWIQFAVSGIQQATTINSASLNVVFGCSFYNNTGKRTEGLVESGVSLKIWDATGFPTAIEGVNGAGNFEVVVADTGINFSFNATTTTTVSSIIEGSYIDKAKSIDVTTKVQELVNNRAYTGVNKMLFRFQGVNITKNNVNTIIGVTGTEINVKGQQHSTVTKRPELVINYVGGAPPASAFIPQIICDD